MERFVLRNDSDQPKFYANSRFNLIPVFLRMHPPVPIPTLHLFPVLDQLLLEILESLQAEDWARPTRAKAWTVKDIAAHLLDGNIRSLSISRDKYAGEDPEPIEEYDDLVRYLNRLNQDWVKAMKRVSPALLIGLLSQTNHMYRQHLQDLDPFAPAIFPVAWAGEAESQNWFHIAREYTEKWHHQQQIREAVGDPLTLLDDLLYKPYLDTSFLALPHHFRKVKAGPGEYISINVNGPASGHWHLVADRNRWSLQSPPSSEPLTQVEIDGHILWRIFSKQISPAELKPVVRVTGREDLADVFFHTIAVMA